MPGRYGGALPDVRRLRGEVARWRRSGQSWAAGAQLPDAQETTRTLFMYGAAPDSDPYAHTGAAQPKTMAAAFATQSAQTCKRSICVCGLCCPRSQFFGVIWTFIIFSVKWYSAAFGLL